MIRHWRVSAFMGAMVLAHTITAVSERFSSASKDLIVAVEVSL